MKLKELCKQFDDVSWRVGRKTKNGKKAWMLAYIDARHVQQRLDDVCGAHNWKTEYIQVGNMLFCALYIKVGGEWVGKSDTGSESNVEKEKGHVSDAFKRAAVNWGVGRYLYSIDSPLLTYDIHIDEWGKITDAGDVVLRKALQGVKIKQETKQEMTESIAEHDEARTRAKEWVDLSKAVLNECEYVDQVTAWFTDNEKPITRLQTNHKDLHKDLKEYADEVANSLIGE